MGKLLGFVSLILGLLILLLATQWVPLSFVPDSLDTLVTDNFWISVVTGVALILVGFFLLKKKEYR